MSRKPISTSFRGALTAASLVTVGGAALLIGGLTGSTAAAPLPPGPVLTLSAAPDSSAAAPSTIVAATTSTPASITVTTTSVRITTAPRTGSPSSTVSRPATVKTTPKPTITRPAIVKTTAVRPTAKQNTAPKVAVVHGQPLTVVLPWTSAPIDDSTVSDGTLEPPFDPTHTGIWVPGATLAENTGTVLIAGHINYGGVEGAFSQLATLKTGDVVTTSDSAGVVTRWKVEKTYSVSKSGDLPAEIFTGKAGAARRLVLATCGGAFDAAARNYLDNVIVELVPA
jgi:hypothetical protein